LRDTGIEIISESFDGNPAIVFSVGHGWGYQFRKKRLAAFLYDFCTRRNGVYFSSNKKGLICFYHSSSKVPWYLNLWDELCVGILAVGPFRLFPLLKRSKEIKKAQAPFGPHLHCWYLGVMSGYRDYTSSAELKNILFKASDENGIPVLAETTIDQNKMVYERMGFQHYGNVTVNGMTTYLLVRHPNQQIKPIA
jgi:hypothetical protein